MRNNWIKKLREQGACTKGLDWASKQESAQAAWNACERGDWMLWACEQNCGKIGSKNHRKMVLACIACLRTSLKKIEDKGYEKRCKNCLDVTEKWAKRETGVTVEDVEISNMDIYSIYKNSGDDIFYAIYDAYISPSNSINIACDNKIEELKIYADIIREIQPKCPRFKNNVTW